tara:strand:+ start:225 stop:884 length:660 start_codon:yes stop_codon:yes gene_type:complete
MSGPFKMKGFSGFGNSPAKQKESKLKVGEGQGSKRKGKYTVDPDAPGYKYGPGYEPPVSKKFSDLTPEEIKQMKLDQPMGSPAKQVDPDAKKVISSGKVEGKEATRYTKGARSKDGATYEKGKTTTYVKQDDDTYTKTVKKIGKGATSDAEWKTKKDKTISAKKAERQIKRKTKRAERSDKKARRKEVKGVIKEAKTAGVDRQERKAMKKFAKQAIKNR